VARKKDLKHVDAVCRRYRRLLPGDLEFEYRNYLHECKEGEDLGSDDGDFTDAELVEKLKEFLGLEELP
jgi:hypothetical protein